MFCLLWSNQKLKVNAVYCTCPKGTHKKRQLNASMSTWQNSKLAPSTQSLTFFNASFWVNISLTSFLIFSFRVSSLIRTFYTNIHSTLFRCLRKWKMKQFYVENKLLISRILYKYKIYKHSTISMTRSSFQDFLSSI